jgi:4-amino-4-deoxy-L-arabinose transferase-like glycosyltransferase
VLAWRPDADATQTARQRRWALVIVGLAAAAAALALVMHLWHWRLDTQGRDGPALMRLLVWFTWPAWPLALWTLWRWRHRLHDRHLALPLWLVGVALACALTTPNADRSLLLALPPLAALAAFALPTLSRPVAALIDWFTLLFFSGIALVIWVVWLSLQTGVPAKPAANVAKLATGFEPSFSFIAFVAALAGTLAWGALVRWRVGRHRAAIWKSLVLPAGGAALCWLLLMTLWLPVLDYARSYVPVVKTIQRALAPSGTPAACVEASGLTRGQIAALRYHGGLDLRAAHSGKPQCPWRITGVDPAAAAADPASLQGRQLVTTARRPTDPRDNLRLYKAIP